MLRRLAALMVLLTLAAATTHSTVRAQAPVTVTYTAGWNLAALPAGSQLSGATGPLYTFQPGDTDYEQVPVSGPFHTGWGYWAYFPSGGTAQLAPGSSTYTTPVSTGQWVLIGDPSGSGTATVSGAESALSYTPGANYQATTTLAPGRAAWVTGSGNVSLAAPSTTSLPPAAVSAPVIVPPATTPTPSGPFIAFPGNGGGPTQCRDGTVSHSSGSGTCSGHGGIAR
jgi:hypothetical protein